MIRAPTSLRAFLDDVYLAERLDMAEGSAEQLQVAVRIFGRFLGRPATLLDLTRATVVEWIRWLAPSRSPATVNSKRQAILALWNEAADRELCPPPRRIPKVREPRREPVVWQLGQLESIFQAADRLDGEWSGVPVSLCWRIWLLTFWDTGSRLTPVMRARLDQVDLVAGTIYVPAEHIKGRLADRTFRLHTQTLGAIAASLPSDRERLFPFPWGEAQVWRHFKSILRSAGLPGDRTHMFHCLRRTAESYAAAERGIEWAAASIGHSVDVARRSYVSSLICRPPALIEALPRPTLRD